MFTGSSLICFTVFYHYVALLLSHFLLSFYPLLLLLSDLLFYLIVLFNNHYSLGWKWVVLHCKMRITFGVIANYFGGNCESLWQSESQNCESLLADLQISFEMVLQKDLFILVLTPFLDKISPNHFAKVCTISQKLRITFSFLIPALIISEVAWFFYLVTYVYL